MSLTLSLTGNSLPTGLRDLDNSVWVPVFSSALFSVFSSEHFSSSPPLYYSLLSLSLSVTSCISSSSPSSIGPLSAIASLFFLYPSPRCRSLSFPLVKLKGADKWMDRWIPTSSEGQKEWWSDEIKEWQPVTALGWAPKASGGRVREKNNTD